MRLLIKDFLSKCDQIHRNLLDLVTFTKEIVSGKPQFFCSISSDFVGIIRQTTQFFL